MSLHSPIYSTQASTYSALSTGPPSIVASEPRQVPVLPYKHASKWNSTMYKHPEPLTITFDTCDMPAGYGVQHADLASYSAALMNSVLVRGGEPVHFPTATRKIQLRIVVCSIGHLHASVDSSPDAYISLFHSGPAMTMSIFPRSLMFTKSPPANWLGGSRRSTPSSSRFAPCSVFSRVHVVHSRCLFPLGGASTQVHCG
jgi:hypothetical protein